MALLQFPPPACAREIELRREIVAAMKLRGSPDHRPRAMRPSSQYAGKPPLDGHSTANGLPPIHILSICDDDGLRLARELLLNQEGYCAESCASSDPLDVFALRSFQVALLCHSVESDRAMCIADTLHRYNPRIHVIRLCNYDPAHGSCFDGELDSFTAPGQLLEVIREVLGDKVAHRLLR